MGTNCTPPLADLLFFYKKDFISSLSDNKQTDINELLTPTAI